MSVVIDSGNIANNTSFPGGNSASFNVTIGASDNLLVLVDGIAYNSSPAVSPDTVKFNGVSMTFLSLEGFSGNLIADIWYMSSPPVGTFALASTWTTNTSGIVGCQSAIPISGAATSSIFGTPAQATSGANNNPAVTGSGGVSGGLYLGCATSTIATTVGTGSGQTDIAGANSLGGGANTSAIVSTIAGSGSGAFTWTGSGANNGTVWGAIAVAINAAAAQAQGSSLNPANLGPALSAPFNLNQFTQFPYSIALPLPPAPPLQVGLVRRAGPGVGPDKMAQFGNRAFPSGRVNSSPAGGGGGGTPVLTPGFNFISMGQH
jgi:hypothetical protein